MVQLSTSSITKSCTLLVFIIFILCNNTRGDPRGPRSSHRGGSPQHRKITNRRQDIERQDRINQWIRTIREAPKGHSLSPSWTSKSRPQVIGVANLPLQNEAVQPKHHHHNQQQHSSNHFHDKQLSVPNFNSISKHKFSNAAPAGGPLRQKRYPGKILKNHNIWQKIEREIKVLLLDLHQTQFFCWFHWYTEKLDFGF